MPSTSPWRSAEADAAQRAAREVRDLDDVLVLSDRGHGGEEAARGPRPAISSMRRASVISSPSRVPASRPSRSTVAWSRESDDLVEAVADEQDGLAGLGEAAQRGQQARRPRPRAARRWARRAPAPRTARPPGPAAPGRWRPWPARPVAASARGWPAGPGSRSARAARVRCRMARHWMVPQGPVWKPWPMARFSATVRSGNTAGFWCTKCSPRDGRWPGWCGRPASRCR